MTTKFIVVDNQWWPKQAAALEFKDYPSLIKHLTDYGNKHKKVYRIDREVTFQLNPSLDQE
jgi:hypothetical protein